MIESTESVPLQDMIFSTVVALVYFCLAIPMAVFSAEWKNLESPTGNFTGSGHIPNDLTATISIPDHLRATISNSLAAAAVS